MNTPNNITIIISEQTSNYADNAKVLANSLFRAGVNVRSTPSTHTSDTDLELTFTDYGLELHQPNHPNIGAIRADFCSNSFKYRLKHGGGRKQAIGRAIGFKAHYSPHIFDATAGLGRDAFVLAALGSTVTCCERSPVIHALLADGLQRAGNDPVLTTLVNRISLYEGSSLELLPALSAASRFDVVYIDPMFPHRTKSALVKKEMRCLRFLTGDDTDSNLLLEKALHYAHKRVVCKRPISAPSLNGPNPHFAIKTKKHRFDVYLTGAAEQV